MMAKIVHMFVYLGHMVYRSKTRSATATRQRRIDVFLGGAPILEQQIGAGLLEFGRRYTQWRFSMRGADFRYSQRWLREQAIDGVLVLINARPVAGVLNRAAVPWVHLLPPQPVRHPHVRVDDQAIGTTGADFFLRKGFLRCAFCGVGTPWSKLRGEGFNRRLVEADRNCEMVDFPFMPGENWGFTATAEGELRRWVNGLESGIAVMAAHDVLANRLVDICQQEGIRIPQDIAVLGVGNHELFCQLSPVPISSIKTAVPSATVQATRMLEAMMSGRPSPVVPPVPPRGVAERRSTDILVYGDKLVAEVVNHIHEHAAHGLTVDDLLHRFPISRRTLSRRFARYVGHAPGVEIRQTRLRQAQRMIEQTSLSLTEIAMACGYADLAHMDRAFRAAMNISPGSLR